MLPILPATSWATYPGANGLIAYGEWPGEVSEPQPGLTDTELFSIAPEGGDPSQLTDNSVNESRPSWSADGRRIAFVRFDGHDWEIWTMRADGTHERQVTNDEDNEWAPYFSPRGGRLLMSFAPHGGEYPYGGNVVEMRTDGADPVRLVGSARRSTGPEYSPNGRRIIFAGFASPYGSRHGIWTVHRDGSHPRLLVNHDKEPDPGENGLSVFEPSFSPDDSQIVYTRCYFATHDCDYETVMMRPATGVKRVVAQGLYDAAISPDGRQLVGVAYTGRCDIDPCGSRIVTRALHGTHVRKVTQPNASSSNWAPFDGSPSWQPIPPP